MIQGVAGIIVPEVRFVKGFDDDMISNMNLDATVLHVLCRFIGLTRRFPIWTVYFVSWGIWSIFRNQLFEGVGVMGLFVFSAAS